MALISQIKSTDNATPYHVRDDVHFWGGRNLLINTKDMITVNTGYQNCAWSASGGVTNGEAKIAATTGWTNVGYGGLLRLAELQGKTLTFSADVKAGTSGATFVPILEIKNSTANSANRKAKYRTYSMKLISNNTSSAPTTTYQRYYFTFTLTTDVFTSQDSGNTGTVDWANDYLGLNIHNHNNYDYYTKNWKLERGNKPTDWSPAPEDIAHVNGECLELLS